MRTQSPRRKNGRSLHHDKQNSPKRQPGLKKAIPDPKKDIEIEKNKKTPFGQEVSVI
jgi:hypothetical protein